MGPVRGNAWRMDLLSFVAPLRGESPSRSAPADAHSLSRWLIDKAISGLPPLHSAAALARSYESNPRYAHAEARIDAMVRYEIGKNFSAGFVTGMAGFMSLPVALPANLAVTWLLQARLSATLANLRGYPLADPWTQSMVLMSLTDAAAPELMRQSGIRLSQWATRHLVSTVSDAALLRLQQRVSSRLLTGMAAKRTVGRMVPVVGAAVGGAFDAYAAQSVAQAARRLFVPKKLLT
jgi:anti-sigma factor RsiW